MQKCLKVIEEALKSGVLHSGCAQKLAGRLNWAGQYLFHRLGRAMLRPIFDRKYAKSAFSCIVCDCAYWRVAHVCCRDGLVGDVLREVLTWWSTVLKHDIVEERAWSIPEQPPAHLFVDARGCPGHCAAVLYKDGEWSYTDGKPAQRVMQAFDKRADNQIMSLELLAISVGLSTFAEELQGRRVIIYSDNTGAEVRVWCTPCVLVAARV